MKFVYVVEIEVGDPETVKEADREFLRFMVLHREQENFELYRGVPDHAAQNGSGVTLDTRNMKRLRWLDRHVYDVQHYDWSKGAWISDAD